MEVVVIIDEIFNDIKNVDVNSLKNNLNYDIGKNDLNDIESFFENNNDDKKNMQYIFKDLRYDIEDINVSDDTAKVRIQYTLPSIKELILKIIPKVVMKNFGTFFDNGITNDVASYVIESIKNELQSGSIKNGLYVYDFSFKKVENKWVLSDVDTLIKDATEYIRSSLVLVH